MKKLTPAQRSVKIEVALGSSNNRTHPLLKVEQRGYLLVTNGIGNDPLTLSSSFKDSATLSRRVRLAILELKEGSA